MSEFDGIEQDRRNWSMWLVMTTTQRVPSMISYGKRHGLRTVHNGVHVTLLTFSEIPQGFILIASKIKDFERRYRTMTIMENRAPIRYSLILHGRKGAGKLNCVYQHGCFIYYRPDGSFRINKVNRKSKAFVSMLNSAKFYGGEIETQEQEQFSRGSKVLTKKQLEARRRVLQNYKGFISL